MGAPKNSHPTLKGWVHPRTGELLKAQKMTQEQVDAFWRKRMALEGMAAPAPAPEPMPQTLHEAPHEERVVTETEVDWHGMEVTINHEDDDEDDHHHVEEEE